MHRGRFNPNLFRTASLLALLAVSFHAAPPAHAQDTVTGAFQGAVVRSGTSEPLAGATVRIVNEVTKVENVTRTNTEGRFFKGLLPPGRYKIIISAPGFQPFERTQLLFEWQSNTIVPVPIQLEPSASDPGEKHDGGGLAVASMPNAVVEVKSADGARNYAKAIASDQLLTAFDDVVPGRYRVTVTREGYRTAQTEVEISPYKIAALTLTLVPSATSELIAGRAGKYHALVIGNDDYDEKSGLRPLKTAANDARAVASVLRDRYGFEEPKLLLNARREDIFAALRELRGTLGADANLVVYYAGHGSEDKEEGRAFWLPVDARRDNSANWISSDDINSSVKAIKARHVLVVSDSCYSGALSRDVSPDASAPTERDAVLLKAIGGRSRWLMASGGVQPVADGGGSGDHSVFASALLRGFSEMDRDILRADELFAVFVKDYVAANSAQTPEYSQLLRSGHDSGDFIFIRRK